MSMENVDNLNLERYEIKASYLKINLLAIFYFLLFILVFALPYGFIWGIDNLLPIRPHPIWYVRTDPDFGYAFVFMILLLVLSLIGIFVHELIHVVCFVVLNKDVTIKDIEIKFRLKKMVIGVHVKKKITAKMARISLITPGLFMGIIPGFISIFMGNLMLLYFGILFVGSAGGDFHYLWLLRKVKSEQLIEDLPDKVGCYVYKLEEKK